MMTKCAVNAYDQKVILLKKNEICLSRLSQSQFKVSPSMQGKPTVTNIWTVFAN